MRDDATGIEAWTTGRDSSPPWPMTSESPPSSLATSGRGRHALWDSCLVQHRAIQAYDLPYGG
jgi:hypothetical protein